MSKQHDSEDGLFDDICGVEGDEGDVMTVQKFNRSIKRDIRDHRDEIRSLRDQFDQSQTEQKIFFAKLDGGMKVMKAMLVVGNVMAAGAVAIFVYMFEYIQKITTG
jgi:hypothetical protein